VLLLSLFCALLGFLALMLLRRWQREEMLLAGAVCTCEYTFEFTSHSYHASTGHSACVEPGQCLLAGAGCIRGGEGYCEWEPVPALFLLYLCIKLLITVIHACALLQAVEHLVARLHGNAAAELAVRSVQLECKALQYCCSGCSSRLLWLHGCLRSLHPGTH